MDVETLRTFILPIVVSLGILAYITYNFTRGGVHVRGKGWQTKQEAPKPYYITQILLIIIFIGQLISIIIRVIK
jgi:membrane protein insertase Oxa1/YidC/SpoIIIJ